MAQMNKKAQGSSSRERLEAELMSEALNGHSQAEKEEGRPHHQTTWQNMLGSQMHSFQTKMGIRRRHPERLLQQSAGIAESSHQAKDYATQSFEYENQRINLPDVYEYEGESTMLANQFYLPQVASQNAAQSTKKLYTAVGLG